MTRPDIRPQLHDELVELGCTPEQADELLDLGYEAGRKIKEKREENDA